MLVQWFRGQQGNINYCYDWFASTPGQPSVVHAVLCQRSQYKNWWWDWLVSRVSHRRDCASYVTTTTTTTTVVQKQPGPWLQLSHDVLSVICYLWHYIKEIGVLHWYKLSLRIWLQKGHVVSSLIYICLLTRYTRDSLQCKVCFFWI